MKNFFIGIIILIVVIASSLFIYRYQILRYSADKIIRKYLPDYVRIEKIDFDAKSGRIIISGFKILNPPDFSNNYLIEIEEVSASYKMKGKNLADGFEILSPVFKKPLLNIERLGDGKCNLSEMQVILNKKAQAQGREEQKTESAQSQSVPGMNPGSLIKLPEQFLLKNGKIVFTDRFRFSRPHVLTFENVDAVILLNFDDRYSKVLKLSSTGEGNVFGQADEAVKWNISMDPTAPKLTMSSHFDVSNVEITPFEPYYDKYSPLVFRKGTFSGTLVFDFNNGSIGSTNEIHLKDFRFYVKPGYENAQFWDTTVPDLVKYFTSPYGEIVFDFKIKGDMENPKFYLGPISKQALTSMAVDKISSAIESMSKSQGQQGGAKTDLEKAKQYIDMFKGLMKK